jgi:hypothetical protein
MKITKRMLKSIIRKELGISLKEGWFDTESTPEEDAAAARRLAQRADDDTGLADLKRGEYGPGFRGSDRDETTDLVTKRGHPLGGGDVGPLGHRSAEERGWLETELRNIQAKMKALVKAGHRDAAMKYQERELEILDSLQDPRFSSYMSRDIGLEESYQRRGMNMKITKRMLKQIIREELDNVL